MARYKRITKRKSLSAPDEFISFWARGYDWVVQNRDKMLLPILVFVVGIALVSGFFYYTKQKELSSSRDLAAILRDFPRPESDVRTDETGRVAVDNEKLAGSLTEFAGRFPGSKNGLVSYLYSGHLLFEKSDFKGAEEFYRRVVESGKIDNITVHLAGIGLAGALQEQGRYADAIEALNRVKGFGGLAFAETAALMVARNYELNGNTDQALKEYKLFLEKYPASQQATNVSERISRLENLS